MSQVLRNVATMPEVTAVASPYGPRGRAQISRDGRIAYATVDFAKQADNLAPADINRVVNAAESAREPGLNVQLGGQAIENTEQSPLGTSVTIGVLAAAAVLFIAFGSLLAMVLPIVTAIAGVGGGLMAIAPLTHAISVVDIAPILGTLIGLGVGIDYALFIVTRHRRGMLAGLTPEEAAVRAIDTSGRAVLFAGSTVCIALLGILILGISFLSGLAVASALTVVFTVLAAVLFGLSMDYQVFLVSRMNEEWVHTHGNAAAVRTGQTETGRVITAAATIMICVFLTFSFMGQRDVAEFGIGLAAAVALDAFILRTVLVPAAMRLFGNANWWLPRWLDRRLPHLAIEPTEAGPAVPVPLAQQGALL